MDRFPTKANSLAHLKDFFNGEINTIIDVGILTGTIELMNVFPDKKHVLIEPIPEFFETIVENYEKHNIDFDLLKMALSNAKGSQKIEKRVHLPGLGQKYNVTASNLIFDESRAGNEPNSITVETDTLDNQVKRYNGPFLIKIDVDGAEFEILEGMNDVRQVYVVIVECWMRRVGQFIGIFEEKGFKLWDIVDMCYMRGQLSQVDLVFINNTALFNDNYKELTPRKFGHSSAQAGNYFSLTEKSVLSNSSKIHRILAISGDGSL